MKNIFGYIIITFFLINTLGTIYLLYSPDQKTIIKYNKHTTIVDTLWMESPKNKVHTTVPIKEDENNYVHETSIFDRINMRIEHIEYSSRTNRPFKDFYLMIFGYIERFIGRSIDSDDIAINDVVRLTNGQLATISNLIDLGKDSQPNFMKQVELEWYTPLKRLKCVADSVGCKISYVMHPTKGKPELLPYSFPNAETTHFTIEKQALTKLGISYIDLNDYQANESKKIFYNTDHHWRIEYAFTILPQICLLLNISSDIFNPQRYKLVDTKIPLIGSSAKRVGSYYTDQCDVVKYYIPQYTTSYYAEYYTPKSIIKREGTFATTVLFLEFLDFPDYPPTLYSICNHGDNPFAHIINKNNIGKGKLLILGDSYAAPIISYLSLAYEVVDAIDLRSYNRANVYDLVANQGYKDILFVQNFHKEGFRFN